MSLINDALKRASQVQKTRPAEPAETIRLQPAQHRNPANLGVWLVGGIVAVLCLCGVYFLWSGLRGSSNAGAQNTLQNSPPSNFSASPTPQAVKPAVAESSPAPSVTSPPKAPTQTAVQPPPSLPQVSTRQSSAELKPDTTVPVALPPHSSQAVTPASASELTPKTASATTSSTGTPANSPAASPAAASSQPPTLPAAAVANASASSPKPTTTASAGAQPPSTSVTTSPVSFPDLKLQGIYFRMSNPSVLINGHNLHVGDIVSGARVVRIERESVTVEMSGQKKVIILR